MFLNQKRDLLHARRSLVKKYSTFNGGKKHFEDTDGLGVSNNKIPGFNPTQVLKLW
jgi:hypothetical protein